MRKMKKKCNVLITKIKGNVLLSKILSAFISQGIGIAFQFIFIIVAGRLLGENVYGQVVYIYTVLSLIMILTKFGFENGMVSLMARSDISIEKKRWCVLFCLEIAAVLSLLIIAIITFCPSLISLLLGGEQSDYQLLKVMSPIILLETWAMILASVIRGFKKITQYYIIYMHIQYGARIIFFVSLFYIFNLDGLSAIIMSYYCSCTAMIICGVYFLKTMHLFSGNKIKFSISVLFRLTIPLLLSNTVDVVNAQIDQYMIGYMLEDSQLAIYSMALNIGKAASFALVAVNSIFAPMISELYYSGRIFELSRFYSMLTKWVVVFNALTVGVISICAEDVLMIAGKGYVSGKAVLIIIFMGQLVRSLVGSAGFLNSMTGKPQYIMYAGICGICVNVVLNTVLIPVWGIRGAAIATASALTVEVVIDFILMYRHLHILPYNYRYLGIIPSFVLAFIPIYFVHTLLDINFILKIMLCGGVFFLIYAICTYLFVTSSEERLHIRSIFQNDRKE